MQRATHQSPMQMATTPYPASPFPTNDENESQHQVQHVLLVRFSIKLAIKGMQNFLLPCSIASNPSTSRGSLPMATYTTLPGVVIAHKLTRNTAMFSVTHPNF
jgi:hypothetical protein